MAIVQSTLHKGPAPTRLRLQAINQDFSDFDEQLRQAARIVGLPDEWPTLQNEDKRSEAIKGLVRARAEWVLRWVLEKLNDEAPNGRIARRTAAAWTLLEWMTHILPVSRSAPYLCDAGFPTILERTLLEVLTNDSSIPATSSDNHVLRRGTSESSETIAEDASPSRKRKRGPHDSSLSNWVSHAITQRDQLFYAICSAVATIVTLASLNSKSEDITQAELMKMVLRTESPQAARILRFWFSSVHQMISNSLAVELLNLERHLDLSLVLSIWELRAIDPKDAAGSSADDFSTECLVPTLTLLDSLRAVHHSGSTRFTYTTITRATQALDRLLAKHLVIPSRSAFLADAPTEATKLSVGAREAKDLVNYLHPLRAKLLQAAQIEDSGESLPDDFCPLFNAVPYLLDLAIRMSPSRTPRGRLVEKPWMQATFQALAECVGCSLSTVPMDIAHQSAIAALEDVLRVVQTNQVSIDSKVLEKIFWYNCGVKYPEQQKKRVHWSLIGSLIQLDPSIFVTETKAHSKDSQTHQDDLADFTFDEITRARFCDRIDHERVSNADTTRHNSVVKAQVKAYTGQDVINQIIIPLLLAFARNRNLLGFFRRWDRQLANEYKKVPKTLEEHKEVIWEDRAINRALEDVFEQYLTQGQITSLIEEHAKRMTEADYAAGNQGKTSSQKVTIAYQRASSSAVIIPAILQSVHSDETVQALQPQLHSLFESYISWVQADDYPYQSRLAFSWFTLCQLLDKLWAPELHASLPLQQKLLYPLIEQATKDMSISRKEQNGRRVDSLTRAAAMLFLLDVCGRLQTRSGSKEIIQTSLRKVMKSLSSSRLETEDYHMMLEAFCIEVSHLLNNFEENESSEFLLTLLARASNFKSVNDIVCKSLSMSVNSTGNRALRNAYSKAILGALEQDSDGSLHLTALQALSHVSPFTLPRGNRESILDCLTDHIVSGRNKAEQVLRIMGRLLYVPNATARVSKNGKTLSDIAEQLHKRDLESSQVLQPFRLLVESTLGHVISDQNQARNRSYLEVFKTQMDQMIESPKACTAARLSILRSAMRAQKSSSLLNLGRYVELLKQCLANYESGSKITVSHYEVIDAFNELTQFTLEQAKIWDSTQSWLLSWVNEHGNLQLYQNSSESHPSPVDSIEYVARLHTMMARFKLYPNASWFINFTLKFLNEPMIGDAKHTALESTRDVLASLQTPEKLSIISVLSESSNPRYGATSFLLLNQLIATLDNKVEADDELKQEQFSLLPRVTVLLAENPDYECFRNLLNCMETILNNKPSLASQYSIECVLSVLAKFTSRSSPALPIQQASDIFSRLCETSRWTLLLHRGRLGGRLHLLLPVLQGLLFCLFIPNASRSGALPSWLRTITATEPVRLTIANASDYSRLLSMLCNPPQSAITKAHQHHASGKGKDLKDPIKAAREKISHFIYPLLASFCRFQLNGRLDLSIREKLMPGIWDVVKIASLDKKALDAMFAGLGRSERDLWRGVWAEWESVHGRTRASAAGDEI